MEIPNEGKASQSRDTDVMDGSTRFREVIMATTRALSTVLVAVSLAALASVHAIGQQKPTVQIPQPGVPEIMTLEGKFVRVAYNNEGYVILGYQIANRTIGQDWIMLDVGITLMERVRDYTLKREALSLDTPDGTVPLPSIEEYRAANEKTEPLQHRLKVQRDSIDYFPPWTHGVNRLGFFSDLGSRAMPWDQAEVSNDRACMGQLYFHVPGGTKLRPVLAEREVRAERRARAIPSPHRGRGKDAWPELRRHQEAGRGRVPQEVVTDDSKARRGLPHSTRAPSLPHSLPRAAGSRCRSAHR